MCLLVLYGLYFFCHEFDCVQGGLGGVGMGLDGVVGLEGYGGGGEEGLLVGTVFFHFEWC